MDNVGQCAICEYKEMPHDGGWCYIFRTAPVGICKKLKPFHLTRDELQDILHEQAFTSQTKGEQT